MCCNGCAVWDAVFGVQPVVSVQLPLTVRVKLPVVAVVIPDHRGATQTLTGANTYTGGTTISAGTLEIGEGGTTG